MTERRRFAQRLLSRNLWLLGVGVLALCVVLFGSSASTTAPDSPGDKSAPKSNGEPGQVEVRFADGSLLKLTWLEDNIDVLTRYGKLTVPAADVRRIDFGLRFPTGAARRLETALGNLGSGDFRQREQAGADLLSLRELAYPSLLKLGKSSDPEVAKRVEEILGKLRESIPAEKLALRDFDILYTDEFPIQGRIDKAVFRARSPYFGDLPLRLADMRQLRSMIVGSTVELTVDSAQYGLVQEQWLDTKIDFVEGAPIQVVASGEVDVYPIGGDRNAYIVGPKGPKRWGTDPGKAMDPPSGSLLGRLGATGKVFVIGESMDGRAQGSGKLHLRIVTSPWGVPPTGSYTVKVKGGSAEQ
jgi:hypothetical protein